MATEKEKMLAQKMYVTACQQLDAMGWTYDRHDEELVITTGAGGEDLPISIMMAFDVERSVASVISRLPFEVKSEKAVEMSVAVSTVNYALVDGCFDYDFAKGTIYYRVTSSFNGTMLSGDVFEYMIFIICKTVDKYNDKLFKLNEGELSLAELINTVNDN